MDIAVGPFIDVNQSNSFPFISLPINKLYLSALFKPTTRRPRLHIRDLLTEGAPVFGVVNGGDVEQLLRLNAERGNTDEIGTFNSKRFL